MPQVSAYNLDPAQTDARWWEGAYGDDLRKDVAAGKLVAASNDYPKGTLLNIGGKVYEVKDKMNKRYTGTGAVDILLPTYDEAIKWGRQNLPVTVVSSAKPKVAAPTAPPSNNPFLSGGFKFSSTANKLKKEDLLKTFIPAVSDSTPVKSPNLKIDKMYFPVGAGLDKDTTVLPGPRVETLKAYQRGENVTVVSKPEEAAPSPYGVAHEVAGIEPKATPKKTVVLDQAPWAVGSTPAIIGADKENLVSSLVKAAPTFVAQTVAGIPARMLISSYLTPASELVRAITGKEVKDISYTPTGDIEKFFLGTDKVEPWNKDYMKTIETASNFSGFQGKINAPGVIMGTVGKGLWDALSLMPVFGSGEKAILKTLSTDSAQTLRSSVLNLLRARHGDIGSALVESSDFVKTMAKTMAKPELKAMPFVLQNASPARVMALAEKGLIDMNTAKLVANPTVGMQTWAPKIRDYYDEALKAIVKYIPTTHIKDYVNQIWDIPKTAKQWNKRTIPSITEGLELGYKMKYDNIADLIAVYDTTKANLIANNKFAKALSELVDENGAKVVMDAAKSPVNWGTKATTVINPYLERALGVGRVAVHPDIAPFVRAVSGNPFERAAAIDGINAFAKTSMLSFSLFHHGALATAHMWNVGPVQAFKDLGRVIKAVRTGKYGALENIELTKDALYSGLQIGDLTDFQKGLVDRTLVNWATKAKDLKIPDKLNVFKGISAAKNVNDKVLWNVLHNSFKLYAYEDLVKAGLADALKAGKNVSAQAVKQEVASFVNNVYGGQVWELFGKDREWLRWMNRLMLSPDWNVSTIRLALEPFLNNKAGQTVARGAYKLLGKDVNTSSLFGLFSNPEMQALRTKMGNKFWTRGLLYFLGFSDVMNYAMSLKYDGVGRHMWQNEPGNRMNIFVGYDDEGRRKYIRFEKHLREVPEFFMEPISKIAGKLSPVIQIGTEQLAGYSTGGYPAPWKGNYGWSSLKERAMGIVSQFIPMSFGGQSFAGLVSTKAGMTEYNAQQFMAEAIRKKDKDKFKEIYSFAVQNGLDASRLFKQAKSQVASEESSKMKYEAKTLLKKLNKMTVDEQRAYVEQLQASGSYPQLLDQWLVKLKLRKKLSEQELEQLPQILEQIDQASWE